MFLRSCLETFLEITHLTAFIGSGHNSLDQHPLGYENHQQQQGVVFSPQNASAGFTCQYPTLTGWTSCNGPGDRSCWLDNKSKSGNMSQYNIKTDYERFSPPGVQREYWLEVDQLPLSPDGYLKPLGQVLNHTFPGPLLEACWGDDVVVHVTNKDSREGTTIHWHGIRQLGTNQMDGVNGVTQCPIAQNDTFTYRFKAEQYGHTWYHSHYQVQYSDGVAGPLTIYGPSSADFDQSFEPIFMSDWIHGNASVVFEQELNGGIPVMENLLLGGKGSFLCSDLDPSCCASCHGSCVPSPNCNATINSGATNPRGSVFTTTFQAGKKYLLRLINSSAEAMFIFSIDGHELEVIATDLVPIKPYKTDAVFIGIGQRYQVIVTAKPSPKSHDGNYWIRTRVATGCGNVQQNDERTGILRYNTTSTASPTTLPQSLRTLCEDEPVSSLRPIVPWHVSNLQGNISNFTFEADISSSPSPHGGFFRWDLTDTPLFLNYSNPTILSTTNKTFSPDYAVIYYNFTQGFVYLVITGENLSNLKRPTPAAHPIHLHGHDFVILAQENKAFDAETDIPKFNFDNPPRRDVALLYAGGYLALAFRPDNPGVWLVHCHLAWHASSGLALQVMERREEILGSLGGGTALEGTREVCKGWEDWNLQFDQVDSGI